MRLYELINRTNSQNGHFLIAFRGDYWIVDGDIDNVPDSIPLEISKKTHMDINGTSGYHIWISG